MATTVTMISRQAMLDDTPVAYWPLDEPNGATARDLSGNARTMTLVGTPTMGVAGPVTGGGTGMTFASNTSYAKRTMSLLGGTNLNQDFSIEAWVHTPDGNGGELVSQSLGAQVHSAIHLYIFPAVYALEILNNAGSEAIAIYVATTGTDYTDDAWHHVVATWSASTTTLKMYVDGVERATKTEAPTGTVDAMDTTTIGTRWRGGVAYGAGAVDTTFCDVALYQSCVSATRVAAHYSARGGTTIKPRRGTFTMEQLWGARGICAFTYADHTGTGFHPTLGDTVVVTDGATINFGGTVSSITEAGLSPGTWPSVQRSIVANDYAGICDQRVVTKTWASGDTVEGVLEDLITDYLDDYGITLDAAQATGDTLEELVFEHRTVTDVLNELAARTGWTWRVSATKVLGMYAAGTTTAPFSITSASTNIQALEWTQAREKYYNRLYVIYGSPGTVDLTDTWTATAGQTTFTLHYAIDYYRAVTEDGTTHYPVGVYGVDSMTWTYDAATNSLRRSSGATVGTTVSLNVAVTFPQTTYVDAAAHTLNPWEAVTVESDCTSYDAAQALATSLITQYATDVKRVRFSTTTSGLEVGQLLTITLADRHLSGDYLVTEIVATHEAESSTLLRYRVEVVSGGYSQGTFLDTYRQWFSGSAPASQAEKTVAVAGEVCGQAGGESGVWAGGAAPASASWKVTPAGAMTAGSWTFASAPVATLADSGATTIFSGAVGTTQMVELAWDSTSLLTLGAVGGSTFKVGLGLALDGSTAKGAGTINTTGGYYENDVKITTYLPSGENGSFTCDSGDGTYTFTIADGLVTDVTSG